MIYVLDNGKSFDSLREAAAFLLHDLLVEFGSKNKIFLYNNSEIWSDENYFEKCVVLCVGSSFCYTFDILTHKRSRLGRVH